MTTGTGADQYAHGVPGPRDRKLSVMHYLVQRELGEDIVTWVRTRRAAGMKWDDIAAEMSATLHLPPDDVVQISRQWIQKWYARALREAQQ